MTFQARFSALRRSLCAGAVGLLIVWLAALPLGAAGQQAEDAAQLEAVVETSSGSFTIRFFPK